VNWPGRGSNAVGRDFYLRADLATALAGAGDAPALLAWGERVAAGAAPADIYRDVNGRRTVRFALAGRSWFLKLHRGVGWAEILRNLLQGRLPVLGAANEYRAARALARAGVDTLSVAAYACSGANPATRCSLLVTEDLVGTVSLEDWCADWERQPPSPGLRMRLVRRLAQMVRRMHAAGINHRDCYLCHFHLDPRTVGAGEPRLYLIDLHRAQRRRRVPRRWQAKDLGGLWFSAMDCGLTRRDLLRFLRHYCDGGLAEALRDDPRLWRRVARRARALYREMHGRQPPPLPEPGR